MTSVALQMFSGPYKTAAAEGALLELKMRLLAGKIPALKPLAHKKRLESIEDLLAEHFEASLSSDEVDHLKLCRQLRNKVLHSDFHPARAKLNLLGYAPQSGGVKTVIFGDPSSQGIIDSIQKAVAGVPGAYQNVADSDADSGIFGWFLELGYAGDFDKAAEAFIKGGEIIERLALIE